MTLVARWRTAARIGALVGAIVCLARPSLVTRADEASPEESPAESSDGPSLDEQLLRDLDEEPSAGQDRPEDAAESDAPSRADDPAREEEPDSLDDELLKGLGGDEADEGMSEDEASEDSADANPLIRLSRRMRQVESLIAQAKSDADTQGAQQEIVGELTELIKKLQQQKQKNSASSSKSSKDQQTARRETVRQPKPSPGQGGDPGDKPATDSSDALKERQAQKPDMGEMEGVLKDVWGQLPRRLREQMMQSPVDEFLPQYALQIEEYFKTLVKKQPDKP